MMSFKEFKASRTAKVAGPQEESKSKNTGSQPSSTTSSPTPSTSTANQKDSHAEMCKMLAFIDDTYRDLRKYNIKLQKNISGIQFIKTVNKFKIGCNEVYEKILESYSMCQKLAQNIVRTIDIFKELCTCLSDLEEYNYRLCEIISIFIVCELRLSVEDTPQEQILVAQRIIYIMRRHLVQEEEHETLYNILRTLVYIPKLFNARNIMCAIFGEFIPIKTVLEVKVLPDKLYILYIIVFYRWMMMRKDGDDKMLIVNFAESFMKPSVSLCSNKLYGSYLPVYTTHSTATRTILTNLKFYRDVRNASIFDNALKNIKTVVNLCDDEEDDDIIMVDISPTTDFSEVFAATRLECLRASMSAIKLEEETVVSMVDLTEEDGVTNSESSIRERNEKWLNEFYRLAKHYRESQLLLEKQQNNNLISSGENQSVICLLSDSEVEEEISPSVSKEVANVAKPSQQNNSEDLFVDNYPPTNTPINCDSGLDSLDAEDENDITKISPRFLPGALRTYQAKKNCQTENGSKIDSDADDAKKSHDLYKAYRRDSIHISSTPPERLQTEDDDSTDVQDENDDLPDEESKTYTHLLTTSKIKESEKLPKQIRPMGPYPTYNNLYNDKVVFSQTISRYPQIQQKYQGKQYYHSDSSEIKTPKKQKKRVQFNTNPLGPTSFGASQKSSLKPALQQPKYKASDAPEYFHLRDFKHFSCPPSIAGSTSTSASNSTTSSIKQQEHLAAASTLFRDVIDKSRFSQRYYGTQSPSLSPASSCSLISSSHPTIVRKKYRLPKAIKLRRPTITQIDNEHHASIINRRTLRGGYRSARVTDMRRYEESSDDCFGVASDSDMMVYERYKSDTKLRKRCAVVIAPTQELIMYERKRDEMYNEILQKQRRKLELRALEKQKEKERDERKEKLKLNTRGDITNDSNKISHSMRKTRTYSEDFMSSDSLNETNFEIRTRRHRQESVEKLKPLSTQIELSESTTKTLLSQIDAHLDKSAAEVSTQLNKKEQQQVNQSNDDLYLKTCDIRSNKGQTKKSERNLLADIAQHLSPYQLDLPDSNNPPRTTSPAPEQPPLLPPPTTNIKKKTPKEKVTVTEHLIIQSLDSFPDKAKSQSNKQTSASYEHEPKMNISSALKSSPCTNSIQNQIDDDKTVCQNGAIAKDNAVVHTDDTLAKMVEESISAFKSVAGRRTQKRLHTHVQSPIPLLISNVESLNHSEPNDDAPIQEYDDEVDLHSKVSSEENIVKNVLTGSELFDKKTNEETIKEEIKQGDFNRSGQASIFTSANFDSSDSCIMNDHMEKTANEKGNLKPLRPTPLIPADLSDISLESENSKHLPEIAEPSPVVTDMSDNSNESEGPINNNNTEGSVSDMSLVMSNIVQSTSMPTSQQESLDISFNQLNFTLSTPTKLDFVMPRPEDDHFNNSTSVLNTPLKFDIQSDLQTNDTSLKNALESESDSNVTKFLDLILNKTVTDAESETRDKIIKELNALTADTATTDSGTLENISRNEIRQEPKLDENGENNESEEKLNDLKKEANPIAEKEYTENNYENSSRSHINIAQSGCTVKEQDVPQASNTNNKLNPPIQQSQELFDELKSAKCLQPMSSDTSDGQNKNQSPAIRQSFNMKCMVRLKRLNIDDHCKTTKKETWVAIPITNAEDPPNTSNDISKCDSVKETTPATRKSCLKYNKNSSEDFEDKISATFINTAITEDVIPIKKPKLENEQPETPTSQPSSLQSLTPTSPALVPIIYSNISTPKSKSKHLKSVSFDLANLTEEIPDNISSNHKQKSKSHAMNLGFYIKNSRTHKKLSDNTLRAAETLQLFVNSINDSTRAPPPAEYNKKRTPIKNKCIAEDETPRPPPPSTLMGTPPCKKTCTEKSRSQIISAKCKDQLVSSLTTASISSIASDITTARIYTSSPLDQTLPEYDDNVDTVDESDLILPATSGSLRRKIKRPKKSLVRSEPVDDTSTDDISNQPECNGEDDTDVVVENEDDVFPQELLPIPAANEHILEEIVSARPSHLGSGTVIRDDYMNIEATDTVPVYLFNDESRDVASPEPIQSTEGNNEADSSSHIKNSFLSTTNNIVGPTPANTVTPSEPEVSPSQETFYQTSNKNKQTGQFGEKSISKKDNSNISSGLTSDCILKRKPETSTTKNKEENQSSSNTCLLQSNQVDTTHHSPEMCNLTLAATATTTTTTSVNSCKIRNASTHDEILFNELQQHKVVQTSKRKPPPATFCAESKTDINIARKMNVVPSNNPDDGKSNGSLIKVEDKFKKLLKEVKKRDRNEAINELEMRVASAKSNKTDLKGSSTLSTTTLLNHEEKSKSKRKKAKSSKSSKNKNHSEKSSKVVLKASKLSTRVLNDPIILTIPKSKIITPASVSTSFTTIKSQEKQEQREFSDIPNAKLFIEKDNDKAMSSNNHSHHHHKHGEKAHGMTRKDSCNVSVVTVSKPNCQSTENIQTEIVKANPNKKVDSQMSEEIRNIVSTTTSKEKSSSSTPTITKKKDQQKSSHNDTSCSNTTVENNNSKPIFVKDKYDLIKSKEKHHHYNHDHHDIRIKEKSKDKTNNHPKAETANSSRSHKSSTKEKNKSGKLKEKHKTSEKATNNQQQPDFMNTLMNTSQNSNKLYLSSSTSTTKISSTHKQSNSKIRKNSSSSLPLTLTTPSPSPSSSQQSNSAIPKSKRNMSATESPAAPAGPAMLKSSTATQSTNNRGTILGLKVVLTALKFFVSI